MAHLAEIGLGSCEHIFMTSSRMLVPSNAWRRHVISYKTHLAIAADIFGFNRQGSVTYGETEGTGD